MNGFGVQEEGFPEVERVVGVYIGEHPRHERVYAVLYTEKGKEFLCRYHEKGEWQMVAMQEDGEEHELDEPIEAPNPLVVAWTLASHAVDDDLDDIVI